ncbi:hypothetical protein [Streptomyces sp. NRRL S-31]|nr:hypothetical protein [Streptomyces sp. NRRL S-31]
MKSVCLDTTVADEAHAIRSLPAAHRERVLADHGFARAAPAATPPGPGPA